MALEQFRLRLTVCVDGDRIQSDGTLGHDNTSNVYRIKSLVKEGECAASNGQNVKQSVRYYRPTKEEAGFSLKSKAAATGETHDDQIKVIVKDIVEVLKNPEDELFLYGFGVGAFIAMAVAAVLRQMGLPKPDTDSDFETIYKKALDVQKARVEEDHRNGPRLQQELQKLSQGIPQIKLVGLFDMIRSQNCRAAYEIASTDSIQHFRQALAFNSRSLNVPALETPTSTALGGRSFIQAWFLGTHQDIGGGCPQDGLSLYPLQWMLITSLQAGLVLKTEDRPSDGTPSPLILAFPHFMGELPNLIDAERIEWKFAYSNNIQVSMFDLAISHALKTSKEVGDFSVRLASERSRFDISALDHGRRSFNSKGLIGYIPSAAYGNIVHPSVYCLLDRHTRLQENPRLRAAKKDLDDFQARCMAIDEIVTPPWLDGQQLQQSGVKAFRILVCGKTGVGKSTLINKVFGVRMTGESTTFEQGVHDINEAFESPNHPGLLIHDSRGWQAGSESELDAISKFLRYRAFQKNAAQALHVIWFCVDSDISRIEEADRRTFATIAQYSHNVPVFIVGTKKDKLVAPRQMQLLEKYMEEKGDYKVAKELALAEAEKLADEQFTLLRDQFSKIDHYKADGYCCISKEDQAGVKSLLDQTLALIADDRVRLFCVAAQVISVDVKISSAVSETFRLGIHAIRSAMAPLPFTGMVSTPTVSRLLCEHILQCFGFPRAAPESVEEIMRRVVLGHLKSYMSVALTQFALISGVSVGVGIVTMGIGAVIGAASCILASPPAARMLLKVACDMILILERSFRYDGKYVSVRQIEDAARYYTAHTITTFTGKEIRLQDHVHNEIDKLVPLKKVGIGFRFRKYRDQFEDIILRNRFGKTAFDDQLNDSAQELPASNEIKELPASTTTASEIGSSETFGSEMGGSLSPSVGVSSLSALSPNQEKALSELEGSSNVSALEPHSPKELDATNGTFNFTALRSLTKLSSPSKRLGSNTNLARTDTGTDLSIAKSTTATSEFSFIGNEQEVLQTNQDTLLSRGKTDPGQERGSRMSRIGSKLGIGKSRSAAK